MADQVVLMRDGRIEQDARAGRRSTSGPPTIFAARFVGTPPMNVLPARSSPAQALGAGAALPPGARPDELAVGIRPEAVRIDPDGLAGRGRGGRISRRRHAARHAHRRGQPSSCGSPGRTAARGRRHGSPRAGMRRPRTGSISRSQRRIDDDDSAVDRSKPNIRGRRTMDRQTIPRRHRGARRRGARQARDRARRRRGLVLLSGRGRRPDHQDHRRLRGRLREGQSRRSR